MRTPAGLLGAVLLLVCGSARAGTWTRADTLTGVNANDQFGWTVAGVGDLDSDGYGDAAVGAHFFTVGANTAAGAVYLYRGGQPSLSPPYIRLDGTSANEQFGEGIAGRADINGDGIADLCVGAHLRTVGGLSAAGAVDVFLGGALGAGPWASLGGEASNDWFGQSVAVGDLDGDGNAEIIVGAPYNDRGGSAAGAVFIYRGGATPSTTPWRILVGEAANDQFGWSVAYVGDFDGDGYGDVVVGARLHGTGILGAAGRAYLFGGGPAMGTAPSRIWTGEAKDDWFGNSVAGPGDVDGGGKADVLVGAPYNDRAGSAAGAAYLFRGEDAPGAPPARIYVGETADAQFGWSVSGAGDVDGDGHSDLTVGARLQASGALSAAGRSYLFAGGSILSTTPIATADGEAADDWFGNSVSVGVGYFAPRVGALFAGAPYNDAAASAAGRAYLLDLGSVAAVDRSSQPGVSVEVRPNPASSGVSIHWSRGVASATRAEVLDVGGRVIRVLPINGRPSELENCVWDGLDQAGRRPRAGVYFVRPLRESAPAARMPVARVVLIH